MRAPTPKTAAKTDTPATAIPAHLQETEGWRPEPGDVLTGKVVGYGTGWSDYTGAAYPIVTIKPADSDAVAVHAFQTVLRNELAEKRPLVGEVIDIAYHGKREHKSNKSMTVAHYVVFVHDREGSGADFWQAFTDPRAAGQTAAQTAPASDVTPADALGGEHPFG